MITLSIEEFTSQRRTAQQGIEDALRAEVARALDGTVNTGGYRDLMSVVRQQWSMAYAAESGSPRPIPQRLHDIFIRTLRKADKAGSDENTIERTTVWLATAIISSSTVEAANDDPEEIFLEWVDMNDTKVRHTHAEASGQVRPIGEDFTVGAVEMPYPGYPGVDIAEWINCRCTVRPVLAAEVLTAATKGIKGRMPQYAEYIITPEQARHHISRNLLRSINIPSGTYATGGIINQEEAMPDETPTPEVTASAEDTFAPEPPPEADECLERDADGNCLDPQEDDDKMPFSETERVPWHAVLAPEGVWSGDKRRFREGSLSHRPLPLPITWQKVSAGGHDGNVVVAVCDRIAVVEGEQRATGWMLSTPEADEVMGLISEFGRFGISVDADSAEQEMNEEEQGTDFTAARTSSACLVAIPAFAEAWFALGEAPEGFLPEDAADTLPEDVDLEEEIPALVAAFADLAPGKTEDGPGWLTHPVPTDRLRDYWTKGEGAAKIAWGTPGDFRRCRVAVAEHVKPQHLNGYCANRHFDATGTWPGQQASADLGTSADTPAVSLVASTKRMSFDHGWFKDPEFAVEDGRMVKDREGNWACPVTVTEDGHVFGHVAGWKTCHGNWAEDGICVTAPHSATGYAHFLTGQIETDIGAIPVGALTYGGGHAPNGLRARAAANHYDATSSVWAYVNVGEDQFGIWLSGVLKPGLSQAALVEAMAAPLSGDWRLRGAQMEMIAAHSVVTPGFSIPRVACGIEAGEQISLVAAGALPLRDTEVTFDLADEIRKVMLANAAAKAEIAKIAESVTARNAITDIVAEVEGIR